MLLLGLVLATPGTDTEWHSASHSQLGRVDP